MKYVVVGLCSVGGACLFGAIAAKLIPNKGIEVLVDPMDDVFADKVMNALANLEAEGKIVGR